MALGYTVCVWVMIGIFTLLGQYDRTVLLGSMVGGGVALANDYLMIWFANLAADKAEKQDVAGAQKLIRLSYMGRMIGMAFIMILCGRSGRFHVIALAAPLIFIRPILTMTGRIRQKGGKGQWI